MSPFTRWIILFCVEILIGLCDAVSNNEVIFRKMSIQERRAFFGTEDGSVPKLELVELKKPTRLKRASGVLDIPFNYHGTDTIATLYFVADHELISTTSTAVWFADSNIQALHDVAYTPRPDILDGIGNFEFYQNVFECSAITKYRKSRKDLSMIGILKQDYTVKSLPRGLESGFTYINSTHSIVSRSVDSKSDLEEDTPLYLVIFENDKPPLESFRRYVRKPPPSDSEPRRTRRQLAPFNPPSIVYPKLLITPDYGVVSLEENVEDFIKLIIAHLNALDMMFRQLDNPDVRLKIGGIIIPRDSSATPYIGRDTDRSTSFVAEDVLGAAKVFFSEETNRIHAETYSAFVVLSEKPMYDPDENGDMVKIAGLAYTGSGCDSGRAMVKYRRGFGGILSLAHELGHVFNAPHDGNATTCSTDGGYAMVPDVGLGRTLKWSTCTRQIFRAFFRSRDAQCTHRHPRGIPQSVHSMPGSWMPILGQCENHMKAVTDACLNSTVTCSEYGCKNGACYLMNDPPMEGTLSVDGQKHCVNQMWVNV